MKDRQLNRLLRLVRRTGEKLVILDKESDAAMVLMDLDDYENSLNDFEPEETTDSWTRPEMLERADPDSDFWRFNPGADDELEPEEEEMAFEREQMPVPEAEKVDNLPEVSQNVTQEENLADVPAQEEEEKFYLEPVE